MAAQMTIMQTSSLPLTIQSPPIKKLNAPHMYSNRSPAAISGLSAGVTVNVSQAALSYWHELFDSEVLSPPEYKYLYPELSNADSETIRQLLTYKLTEEMQVLAQAEWSGHNAVGLTAFWLKVLSQPRVPQLRKCKLIFIAKVMERLVHANFFDNPSATKSDVGLDTEELDRFDAATAENPHQDSSRQFSYNHHSYNETLISSVTQSTPLLTQSTPLVTQSTPLVTLSTPLMTQSTPLVTQSTPLMIQSTPLLTESSPLMTQSSPLLTQSIPLVTQSMSLVTQSMSLATQSTPLVTESSLDIKSLIASNIAQSATSVSEDVSDRLSLPELQLPDSLLYQEDGKPFPSTTDCSEVEESHLWVEVTEPEGNVFSCKTCHYKSTYKSRIKQHMRSVHSSIKPYKCSQCGHSTAIRASLTKHINAVHRKVKPFSCSICSYSCSLKRSLEVHMSGFHEKQYKYTCTQCSYAASSKNVVDIHIQAVHKKEKPYKCPHCEYSSAYPQYIPKHIAAVHDRRKPFACPHCPYRSSYKTYLQKHCDAVHNNIKPFSCPHCSYVTSYSQYLNKHISAVHNDEKPHKCPLCDFRCAYKQYINKHIDLVHSGHTGHSEQLVKMEGQVTVTASEGGRDVKPEVDVFPEPSTPLALLSPSLAVP